MNEKIIGTEFGSLDETKIIMRNNSYSRGYVSRKDFDLNKCIVHFSRKLNLYYLLLPAYNTTRYYIKSYFVYED
jgi:hypothetical protein